MSSNALYITATVVVAIGVIFAGIRWLLSTVYKRGASEREYKVALDANTEVTRELTGVIQGVLDTQTDHTVELAKHDLRITRLEATPSVNVSVTPHRDASSTV